MNNHNNQPTATTAGAQESGGAEYTIPPALIPYLNRISHAKIAHGTIMCLAFVIFFPAGSFVIRLGRFKGVVYVHAGIQMFAYIMALAGMGLGIYVSNVSTKFGRPSLVSYAPQPALTQEPVRAYSSPADSPIPSHHRSHNHLRPPLPAYSRLSSPCRLPSATQEIYLVNSTRVVGPRSPDIRYYRRRFGLTFREQHDGRQDSIWCCCGFDLGQLACCCGAA